LTAYVAVALASAAGAALAALVLSVIAVLIHHALRPILARASAALRADVALLTALIPSAGSIAVVVGAVTPAIASALGLGPDHCPNHTHHLHLCIDHAATLPLAVIVAGAIAMTAFSVRAMVLVSRIVQAGRRISALERLGTVSGGPYPVICVPGAPRLCHATGWLRPRILLSADLVDALAPAERDAALAHENAHLRRRDPLASILFAAAGLFSPLSVARVFHSAYRDASEEACDADAARAVGSPRIVAEALLKVATLQTSTSPEPHACPAFAELALERRIRLLLTRPTLRAATSHGLSAGAAFTASLLLIALAQAPSIHHVVETVLDQLF